MGYDMIVPNTLGSIIAEVLNTAQMSWTSDHGSFKNAYQVLPLQQRPRAACANLLFNATCAQTTQASFLTSWWGVLHSEHSCRKQSYGHHSPINKNSAVNMLFEQTKIWCVISPPWNHIIYIYICIFIGLVVSTPLKNLSQLFHTMQKCGRLLLMRSRRMRGSES